MCTSGYSNLGTQVFGSISEATGTYYGARGERRAMKYEADIADINARLSDMSASYELEKGRREEQIARMENRNVRDAQKVGYAANGVALDSETAIRVATSTEVLGEIDANTINTNAARAAWGYRMEGIQHRNDALIGRANASSVSPGRRTATSLISSVGNIYDNYTKLKKSGAIATGRGRG